MSAQIDVPPFLRPLTDFVGRKWIQLLISLQALKMMFWFHALHAGRLPFINVDYVQFYGRSLRMHEFLSRSGRIWGYDPFDMGGYLSGPFLEVGAHVLGLFAHALSPIVPIGISMLGLEMLGLAMGPFLLVPGARLLGATREQAWTAFGLAVFMTGGVEPFSTGMYKLGLWGWMVSSCLALPLIGLFWRWLNVPSGRRWALFTICWAVVSAVHPSSVVNVALPLTVAYALRFRSLDRRRHLELLGAAVTVLALNWFWISPFLAFSRWRVTAPYYDTAGFMDLLARFGPFQVDFYTSVRALIHALVLALALRGLARVRAQSPATAILLGAWLAWLALISFFGSALPWIRTLQPGRNEFPLWLLCYVLSGFSLADELRSSGRTVRISLLLAAFSLLYVFEKAPGASPWSKYAAPLTNRLPRWQQDLIDFIRENRPEDGRILLECNDDLQPHFADIIPPLTGAILIGGQHPGTFVATRSTLFSGIYVVFQENRSEEPTAFGHSLRELGERGFADYLDLYNVRMVIARTPQTLRILSGFKDTLDETAEIDPHRVFTVKKTFSWFAEGSGRVAFAYDRITVDGASRGRLVLKAHWLSTFKASPPAPLSPVYLMDDPVPFISVDNSAGSDHIEIFNAGLPSLTSRIMGRFRDDWGHRQR